MSKTIQQSKEQFWREHIQNKEQLGLSANAYCREMGLVTTQMRYWQRKLYGAALPSFSSGSLGFSEVHVVEESSSGDRGSGGCPDPQWVAEFLVHLWRQR